MGNEFCFVGNLRPTNFVLWELECPIGSVGYNSRFVRNIFFSLKLYFSIFWGN